MLRHIVMWKFKSAPADEHRANVRRAVELLTACRGCVPGIVEFELGAAAPGFETTYDLVLNSLFRDRAALEAYQQHPVHQAALPFMASIRSERQCMDYELPGAGQ
ncbi:Dabb family protein [Pigmentiphaga soli]|uniref:Dabb family protein n=1 Tax=Pigmentiphaga soli TaxID=1007095 RepID=A0ABP8H7Z4_9BURK